MLAEQILQATKNEVIHVIEHMRRANKDDKGVACVRWHSHYHPLK